MNFRDAYKSANDEIHADRQLLDNIIKGKKSKKAYYFRPAYTYGCAAAAVIIVIALTAYPDLMHQPKEIVNQTQYAQDADKAPDGSTEDGTAAAEQQEEASVQQTAADGADNHVTENGSVPVENNKPPQTPVKRAQNTERPAENKKSPQTSVKRSEKETQPTAQTVQPQSGSGEATRNKEQAAAAEKKPEAAAGNGISASSEKSVSYETELDFAAVSPHAYTEADLVTADTAPNTELKINRVQPKAVRSAAGGSGGAAPRIALYTAEDTGAEAEGAAPYFESISIDEYYDYIGFNVAETLKKPDDMSFEIPAAVMLEKQAQTGAVLSDTAAFFMESENDAERYISVTTTRLSGDASEQLNSSELEKSTVNGTSAVVIYDGESYDAYTKKEDTYLSVSAYGIEENELKELLISVNQ